MIPAGPSARSEAQKALRRLANQVDERRNPRTSATVDQLLEHYLDQFDGAASTLKLYRGYVRNHISPFLDRIKVGALDADTLDSPCRCPRRSPQAHLTTRLPRISTTCRRTEISGNGAWNLDEALAARGPMTPDNPYAVVLILIFCVDRELP